MNHLYELNLDQISRDEIIGVSFVADQPMGGIRDFKNLTIQQLQKLIDYRFTPECEAAETGPMIAEFLAFARQLQQRSPTLSVSFDGYAIESWRWDYRVTIEAITIQGDIALEIRNLFLKFACGSENRRIEADLLYAWFD